MDFFRKKRVYLDYAAATPVLPEVKKEMEKYWTKDFYNPNAIYKEGVEMRKEVEEYRLKIAKTLGIAKESIIFTSGGAEANVWAVKGVKPGRVIVEEDSHPSVVEAAKGLVGKEITLVSSVTTGNFLGRKIRAERKKNGSEYPLIHIDASQSANYFEVGLEALACDLLTLDSAKLYGPKGIGVLVVRRGIKLNLPPQGTPAVPLIAGFTKALEIAVHDRDREKARLLSMSESFAESIRQSLPTAMVVVSAPNVVNVSVPGILPELLVLALDREGVMVSAGPACDSNKPEPPETPVRFSFGRATSKKDLDRAVKIFCRIASNMIKYGHAAI